MTELFNFAAAPFDCLDAGQRQRVLAGVRHEVVSAGHVLPTPASLLLGPRRCGTALRVCGGAPAARAA